MKRINVQAEFDLFLEVEDGIDVNYVLNKMDFLFYSNNPKAEIVDSEMVDFFMMRVIWNEV